MTHRTYKADCVAAARQAHKEYLLLKDCRSKRADFYKELRDHYMWKARRYFAV